MIVEPWIAALHSSSTVEEAEDQRSKQDKLSLPEEAPNAQTHNRSSGLRGPSHVRPSPDKARDKQGLANKVAIPTNTFFKAKREPVPCEPAAIGAKVVNKDGEAIGTISDLIVGQEIRSRV